MARCGTHARGHGQEFQAGEYIHRDTTLEEKVSKDFVEFWRLLSTLFDVVEVVMWEG
jgi:hypothetical protein